MSRSILTRAEMVEILSRGEIIYYKGKTISSLDDPDLPVDDAQILADYPDWDLNPSAYSSANAVGIDGYPVEGSPSNGDTIIFNSVDKAWQYAAAGSGGGGGSVVLTGDVTGSGFGTIPTTITNLAFSKLAATTASRAIVSNSSGVLSASTTTSTEVGYLSGVTSAIQTQINSKMTTSVYDPNADGYVENSTALKILVHNMTGSVIPKGSIVYINGSTGTHPTIALAQANSESTSSKTIGAAVIDFNVGDVGEIIVQGTLENQNTLGYTAGDILWLSPTVAGGLVTSAPTPPNHSVFIGYVARVNQNNGKIVYRILNGFELGELHNVLLDSSPPDNHVLTYEQSSGLWKNKVIPAITVAGNSVASGGSVTQDSITGLSSTGIIKRTGTNTLSIATAGTDYANLAFKSVAVSGQSTLTAADAGSTLTLAAGSGIQITTGSPNTVTITSTGGGTSGTKTINTWSPRDNQPPATNFATMDTRNSIAVLDFTGGGSTNKSAIFIGSIPEGMSLTSGIIARILWTSSTATSGNCRWGVQIEKLNTAITADSFDTAFEANTAAPATSGIPVTTSITCTSIDGLTAGDFFRVKIYRDSIDTANDTMSGDAELIALELRAA